MAPAPVSLNMPSTRWWQDHLNETGLILALVVMIAVFSQIAPNFLSDRNLINVLRSASYVGILAFPMTFVIIAGEIDISVGPAVAFFGIAFAKGVAVYSLPIPLAFVLMIGCGAVIGGLAGWVRVRYAVPTFIATLALWSAMRGGAHWWSDSLPVIIPSRAFRADLGGSLLGLPTVTWVMLATFVIFAGLARFSRYGRYIYALGASPATVAALGINVTRLRVAVMATTGAFAALTGILIDARLGSGNANAATGLEFDVIAAVIVGGTLLSGGHGRMTGTLLGVLVIAILSNGLVLVGVDPDVQEVVRGGVILAAVIVNAALAMRARSGRTT